MNLNIWEDFQICIPNLQTFKDARCRSGVFIAIGTREEIFQGGRVKIARKILLHKNMLMIRSIIDILSLVFTYFMICLRNKEMSLSF